MSQDNLPRCFPHQVKHVDASVSQSEASGRECRGEDRAVIFENCQEYFYARLRVPEDETRKC